MFKKLPKLRVVCPVVMLAAAVAVGCDPEPPRIEPVRFETLPAKQLPDFLKGTILERMDHANPDPVRVSNWGLVVNLPGTGDGTAPAFVRKYIVEEASKHGFGSAMSDGYQHVTPDKILDDPSRRAAIVRVDGFMHAGIRKGETFDVVVSALQDSGVTSLAGGDLYTTDLKIGGADGTNPRGVVDVQAKSAGTLFVNPALALNPGSSTSNQNISRTSRRVAVILDGGLCVRDQVLVLRLRAPQRSVMRQIQARINEHFDNGRVADPKNEAIMYLTVPASYRGDWERFIGVTMHLYLDGRPELLTGRARRLAEEALKRDAPLQDISFAWEAMGDVALPAITPLMSATYSQDVQFAAARAAACIGDPGASSALVRIASTPGHKWQTDAVRTLGMLPPTPGTARMLRKLLDSDSALVRIEAYKMLAANKSNYIVPTVMPRPGVDEKFVLDMVPVTSAPLVYATRSGVPRIAVFGTSVRIVTPLTFTALDDRLTITSVPGSDALTVFYRPLGPGRTIKILSRPDLAELIGWLGGYALDADQQIDLSYGEIVAIVQALAEKKCLVSGADSQLAAAFVLQPTAGAQGEYDDAPPFVPRGRPQSDVIPGLPTTRQLPQAAVDNK